MERETQALTIGLFRTCPDQWCNFPVDNDGQPRVHQPGQPIAVALGKRGVTEPLRRIDADVVARVEIVNHECAIEAGHS